MTISMIAFLLFMNCLFFCFNLWWAWNIYTVQRENTELIYMKPNIRPNVRKGAR